MSIKDFNKTNMVNGLDMGDFYPGEYFNVEIFLETGYHYCQGWENNIDQKIIFDKEIREELGKLGFEIKESTTCGAAPELKRSRSKTNLYLHPLKFSGFAKKDEIEQIVETLKKCTSIKEVLNVVMIPSYDIDETQHARILSMNINFIEDFIREKAKTMKVYDIPSAFARKYAIMTTGKSCVFGSHVFEWRYTQMIIDTMLAKGELEAPDWY